LYYLGAWLINPPQLNADNGGGGRDIEAEYSGSGLQVGIKLSLLFWDHLNICLNYIILPQYESTFHLIFAIDFKW